MLPDWVLAIRGRAPRRYAIPLGFVPIIIIAVAWWMLTHGAVEERAIGPNILPSPGEVFSGEILGRLFTDRDLVHHILVSLRRVALGFLLASVVVLPLGVLMGAFGSVRATFAPTVTASGYIPIATLVPLTMSWFGTGEMQKIVFLAMAFGVFLLPMVVSAIDRVPDIYLRTSYTLGTSRVKAVTHVLIPIAAPDIWHALRLAFGVGWTYLVLTEVVVLVDGLGYLIAQSQRRGPREHIYLVIITITIIAWIADLGWVNLGRLLFPYRRTRR